MITTEEQKKEAHAFYKEALDILNEFPDSEIKKAMTDLVSFVTDRKY